MNKNEIDMKKIRDNATGRLITLPCVIETCNNWFDVLDFEADKFVRCPSCREQMKLL